MNKQLSRITKTPTFSTRQIDWFVIDAKDQVLGRLATVTAKILIGKNKAVFTPGKDMGDHVIVLNADRVAVTGRKETDKNYYRHTGYPGGLKSATLAKMRETHPDRIVYEAVKGMLPKNRLGSVIIKKLHVVIGSNHSFSDRKPTEVTIG